VRLPPQHPLVAVGSLGEPRVQALDASVRLVGQAVLVAEQAAASIAFGDGKFDRDSIYVTELRGGRILKIPVGVRGARLLR
jgi:hypothetical protein